MSVLKEAWETLRSVVVTVDRLTELSGEVKALHDENRELRDRVVRIETIIAEARRQPSVRALPPRS